MEYYAIFEDDWPNSMKLTNHGHFQSWDEAADTFDKLFGNANLGSKWKLVKLDDEDRMYHKVIYDLTKSEALVAAMADQDCLYPRSLAYPGGAPRRGLFARVVLVVLLSMALPVGLSIAGPIYYGYTNDPYWRVLIWAAVCTIGGVWFYRNSFTAAFSDAHYSSAIKLANVVAIVLTMGLCFLAGDSAIYFLVRSISN
jgi:hypothetical protein